MAVIQPELGVILAMLRFYTFNWAFSNLGTFPPCLRLILGLLDLGK